MRNGDPAGSKADRDRRGGRQSESIRTDIDLGDLRREIAVRYVSMVDEALDLALLPAAREQPRQ